MKTNFLAKAKWYIIGFILIAVMLSVPLSFSAWDTLSFKAIMNAKGGDFKEKPDKPLYLGSEEGDDVDGDGVVDVGDRVIYGNFYKDKDAAVENSLTYGKTEPLRWIVVDYNVTTKVATLLAEKIVVYGNYFGGVFLNDYYRSTVRSWLNSGKGSLMGSGTNWVDSEEGRYNDNVRNDNVGSAFGIGQENQVNKGFLDVAFTDAEKKLLVPKSITGMKYVVSGSGSNAKVANSTTTTGRTSINDLVWLPSYQEIYGAGNTPWGAPIDPGYPQFQSISNTIKITGGTPYAQNAVLSSYFNNGGGGANGSETVAWWWLRSPDSSGWDGSLYVSSSGDCGHVSTGGSVGGVRPAVCVQL